MFTGLLHPYQADDVDRIVDRGSMLAAYGMGTGKTVMAIAAAEMLMDTDKHVTCMVVVPAALKWQWAERIAQFTDVDTKQRAVGKAHITVPADHHCVVIDGTPAQKQKQFAYVLEHRPDYVITAYDHLVHDWTAMRKIKPSIVIADEASLIKTFNADRTRKIKRIKSDHRIGLTGTVMDNGNPEEIFSILQWVDPEVLGPWEYFDPAFIVRSGGKGKGGFPVAYKNLPLLHQKVSTAMVRKTREDPEVAAFMPDVDRGTVLIDLDEATAKVYRRIAKDTLFELTKAAGHGSGSIDLAALYSGKAKPSEDTAQGRVMGRLLALHMLVDHPGLIRDSAARYEAGKGGSRYCLSLVESGMLDGLDHSPKLEELGSFLRKELLRDPDLKVVVFSFFKGVLKLIAEEMQPFRSVSFTGDHSALKKAEAKALFSYEKDMRLFLASGAGGYGLDLPEARILVNFDQRDSAGAQDQQDTRHVRASSKHEIVRVVDFMAAGTVEERRQQRRQFKTRTAAAILDGRGADADGRVVNDVETLRENLERSLRQLVPFSTAFSAA
ncbi:DEAD/DEAH box helicase [Streptomyces sp. NPDC004528]|uniref:DEAD/DEAH box helicase n=1 Tax=Streptomyces sp. NPDC004528 TaxID=3154550 RepID=UPI0033AEDA4C